ncbi:MAG: TMEM143 family protein [Actinomycetota bacterium]|nr:TMEM143 family protein [Actinomycetota bacterium]
MVGDAAGQALTRSPGKFIPFRRADLVEMLSADDRLPASERDGFRSLAELLSATFHFEFRSRLEALKDAYAPFAHDPDTRVVRTWDESEKAAALDRLVDGLRDLLEDANFRAVSQEEIERAFEDEALLKLRVEVDFDNFEHLLFFRRGETHREQELTKWFGLRKRTLAFTNYEKVLMLVTFKEAEYFAERDQDLEDLSFEPGSTIIKLFQNVPRADIEMLFPNAQVRMRLVDKLRIGVPALVSGIIILSTKLLSTLGLLAVLVGFWLGLREERVELNQATLITLGAGLGALGGYLTRQFNKLKKRKLEFMNTLARNLYFRNLDNDAGVFHNLLDSAEEAEVKETLLGWFFLRTTDRPLNAGELDQAVEEWFAERWDCRLNFEVDDSIAKLRRLRLVEEEDSGRLTAVPVDEAMRRLDEQWDRYFEYHARPPEGQDRAQRSQAG